MLQGLANLAGSLGFLLSLFTVVRLWYRDKPLFIFAPYMPNNQTFYANFAGDLIIKVVNPSNRPMQITHAHKLFERNKTTSYGLYLDVSKSIDESVARVIDQSLGIFPLYIAPNSTREIKIHLDSTEHKCFLIIRWHRHGILPRFPYVLYVSGRKAKLLQSGA